MARAILTRFKGPTNHHGPRIVASHLLGRATVAYNYELSSRENHEAACAKLRAKLMGWDGQWVCGELPNGSYAHVYVPGTGSDAKGGT